MIPISKMAAAVQPSATLAAGAKARQLKTEGKLVHDFSLGEPDFNTPKHICDAAYQAMMDGHTHYTAASGIAELRGVIARWYRRTYGYEFSPSKSSSPTARNIPCTPPSRRPSDPATKSSSRRRTGSAIATSYR